MISHSNRGKIAEVKLAKHLAKLSLKTDTAWHRLSDAHAGSFAPALADFLLLNKGQLYLIECKQVNHAYRLPHSSFNESQVARMRVWQLAGASAIILVYHTPLDAWRGFPLDYFLTRTGGSWDFRDTPTVNLESLL